MAIVIFASPTLHRDVTVYATAGDTKTVLSLGEKNEVKILHDWREGDCGSCLIEVKYLAGKPKMAIDLTDKEKGTLQSLGRITAAQIEAAEVNHVAPPYRLACQFIARDEDTIIIFTGEPGGADWTLRWGGGVDLENYLKCRGQVQGRPVATCGQPPILLALDLVRTFPSR